MNPIASYEDLAQLPRYYKRQHWLYVILANASDPTPAARSVLSNLEMFDLDTGKDCDYFLPGFVCGDHGPADEHAAQWYFRNAGIRDAFLPRLGRVPFSATLFVKFYRTLEVKAHRQWRYSGRCELLLFNIDAQDGQVDMSDFYVYDLDDIVKNNHSISEFIRGMIMISQDNCEKTEAKRRIDEIYYETVMPQPGHRDEEYMLSCRRAFEQSGFVDKKYCFISYSSRDYNFVKRVHDILESNGLKCWMAPMDIPRGTSYPYILENAILNATMFILMLSRNSLQSIWVEKELLRALSHFQHNAPERICITWCNGQLQLRGTAFALPLENIQFKVDLEGDPENCSKLAAEYHDVLQQATSSTGVGETDQSSQPDATQEKSFAPWKPSIGEHDHNPYGGVFLLQRLITRTQARKVEREEMLFFDKLIDDLCTNISAMKKELLYLQEVTSSYMVEELLYKLDSALATLKSGRDIKENSETKLAQQDDPMDLPVRKIHDVTNAMYVLYECIRFYHQLASQ